MDQSRFANPRFRKYVNFFLLAVGCAQLGITGYLKLGSGANSSSHKEASNGKVSQTDLASVAPLPSYSPAQVIAAPAVEEKPVAFVEPQRLVVEKKSGRVLSPKLARQQAKRELQAALARHRHQDAERMDADAGRPTKNTKVIYSKQAARVKKGAHRRLALQPRAGHTAVVSRRVVAKTGVKASRGQSKAQARSRSLAAHAGATKGARNQKIARALPAKKGHAGAKRGLASNEREESLESVLGADAIHTSNELIAENDGLLPRDRLSIARELGIRDTEFRKIWRKEQELKKKLRRADASGSTGLRRMLISDHRAWMREYLGDSKYERYMELAR